jgi:hypothetical protein
MTKSCHSELVEDGFRNGASNLIAQHVNNLNRSYLYMQHALKLSKNEICISYVAVGETPTAGIPVAGFSPAIFFTIMKYCEPFVRQLLKI